MRKFLLTCVGSVCLYASFAQESKNYILEINGDTIHVALGETATFKSKSGQAQRVKVTRKEFINFSNNLISFDYPSQYSITTTKIDDESDQLLIMTATGTGVMIQVYRTINPEDLVDVVLEGVTKDDVNAGYKQTVTDKQKKLRDGTILKGKSSVLRGEDDISEFVCFAKGKGEKGILVMEMKNDITDAESAKLLDIFWKTLAVKF